MSDCVLILYREKTQYPATGEAFTRGMIFSPESDQSAMCQSVEDEVRATGEKVYGKTAIPEGRYRLKVTMSNRFKKRLPLLLDVPGFEGIRIHAGNKAEDSHGCVIVGLNRTATGVSNCQPAVDKIIALIGENEAAGVTTWLSIVNTDV